MSTVFLVASFVCVFVGGVGVGGLLTVRFVVRSWDRINERLEAKGRHR